LQRYLDPIEGCEVSSPNEQSWNLAAPGLDTSHAVPSKQYNVDGNMDWVRLAETKESYPIQLAENVIANGISHEPAFNWWVHKVLKRKNRLIKKVRSKYWRTTHKFGIAIPKSVEEAYEIDRLTGTSHWTRAIEKEMKNVRIAFEKLVDKLCCTYVYRAYSAGRRAVG